MKKILCIGDLHCGHFGGLTPPEFWWSSERNNQISDMQRETWACYKDMLDEIGEVDVAIVNGDLIDGKGNRSGSTELVTADLNEQIKMACRCIEQIKCKHVYLTYGTPYHTSSGSGEDMEQIVANYLGYGIKSHLKLKVDGVVFDVRHDVNSSAVPYARNTALAKTAVWDRLNKIREEDYDLACNKTVYVRSHVHYYNYCGDYTGLALTLPALQTSFTKFGKRRCVGTTDWGGVLIEVENGEILNHKPYLYTIHSSKDELIEVL
jgi:hypothetical protein